MLQLNNVVTLAVVCALLVAGCTPTRTNVIPFSANELQILTEASHSCGALGAQQVAFRQAAFSTLERGFDSFIVTAGSASNQARGSVGRATVVGSTIIGSSNVYNTYKQVLVVRMYRSGDPAGHKAINARSVLGPDWQTLLKEGMPNTCK